MGRFHQSISAQAGWRSLHPALAASREKVLPTGKENRCCFVHRKPLPVRHPEYLVVGLGNPGSQYECTRHNAGFIAMDIMAEKLGFDIKRLKFKGLIGDTVIDGHRVAFLKPSTFMNLSGESVRDAMQFYKIPVEKLLVICDDISLAPGRLRIRRKGSAGGHNGLKNIIYLLGRDDFARVKLGVGEKPHPDYDLADWVLGRFTKEQGEALEQACSHCDDIVRLFVAGRLDEAMNRYNS